MKDHVKVLFQIWQVQGTEVHITLSKHSTFIQERKDHSQSNSLLLRLITRPLRIGYNYRNWKQFYYSDRLYMPNSLPPR